MTDDTPPHRLPPTGRSLPIALLRAREAVMGPIRDMLGASGVSEQKWRVLRVLDEQGPLELTPLAREACLLLPSLTRMIRAMEAEGLIRRETPETDRRRTLAAITPAGRAILAAHAERSAEIFRALEAAYGARNLETLLDLLERLRTTRP